MPRRLRVSLTAVALRPSRRPNLESLMVPSKRNSRGVQYLQGGRGRQAATSNARRFSLTWSVVRRSRWPNAWSVIVPRSWISRAVQGGGLGLWVRVKLGMPSCKRMDLTVSTSRPSCRATSESVRVPSKHRSRSGQGLGPGTQGGMPNATRWLRTWLM